MNHIVAEWRFPKYFDTGIRTNTYSEAEAESARLHKENGTNSRFLPFSVARAKELGIIGRGR